MNWLKIFGIIGVVICISIFTIADLVVAGETINWQGTGFTTKFEQMEVGDVEGHIIAVSQGKQVFINKKTGEKTVSISTNTMDINPKTGKVTLKGYGVGTAANGDQLIREQVGQAVGKGHYKGTFTWLKGTGQYEGVKGGGTWESWTLSKGVTYYEVVDKRE